MLAVSCHLGTRAKKQSAPAPKKYIMSLMTFPSAAGRICAQGAYGDREH